jgi:hypothetical protein
VTLEEYRVLKKVKPHYEFVINIEYLFKTKKYLVTLGSRFDLYFYNFLNARVLNKEFDLEDLK